MSSDITYRIGSSGLAEDPFFHGQEASFDYLQNEAERTLLEALDSLEVAFSHPLIHSLRTIDRNADRDVKVNYDVISYEVQTSFLNTSLYIIDILETKPDIQLISGKEVVVITNL
uniref:Uncharacterized protein n=1 Tax=Magallana gigas TaxID=29159 RepID=K1PS20_MAGGI